MKDSLNTQEAELNARKMLAKLGWSNAVEFKESILKLKNVINLPEYFATDYGKSSWDEVIKCVDAWELVHKDFESVEMASYEHLVSGSYADPYWIDVKKAIALVKEVESLKEVS